MCKTQINVQPLIDVQSSNPCPIFTSQTSVPQIYVLFFKLSNWHPILISMSFFKFLNRHPILISMSIFKFSNRHPILKSMVVSHFLKSNDFTDVCPNPKPNQKIGHRSENLERTLLLRIALNWTVIWDNDVSGCQIESGHWSESITCILNKSKLAVIQSRLFRAKQRLICG